MARRRRGGRRVEGTTGAPINLSGVETVSVEGVSTGGRGDGDQSELDPELSGVSVLNMFTCLIDDDDDDDDGVID